MLLDRAAEEAAGTFGAKIRELRPDCVIDLTAYTLESTQQLVEALRGHVQQFLHCGTIWVHGPGVEVPVTEEQPRTCPISDYGVRKAAIEAYLLDEARRNRFPATVLHPGHLVGTGWVPLNPAANFNPAVFADLAAGREIALPNLGRETLHHVHADDVAQAFVRRWVTGPLRLANAFTWFLRPRSRWPVTRRQWPGGSGSRRASGSCRGRSGGRRFRKKMRESLGTTSRDRRIAAFARRSGCLDYRPRYRSLEAVRESVAWLVAHGVIEAHEFPKRVPGWNNL